MFKIATLNNISPKGLIRFDDKYTMVEDVNDASGILVRSYDMHSMEFSPNLKAIARAGAGVNNIPIAKCAQKGIVVFNTPGANANAVKELVIAGLLISARNIHSGIEWTKTLGDTKVAEAVEKGKKQFAGNEIKGKTLCVIGLGAIGVMVANTAIDLGMHVIGYDPFISVKSALELSRKIELSSNLDAVLPLANYVTVHIPMMNETKGMLNRQKFSLMREGVKVLNFSRGEIVNDDDLLEAIDLGIVSYYVTDFPNDKLLGNDKVICTPHLGASTEESEENCAMMAVDQIADYLENGNITNSVNYPDCSLGPCVSAGRIAVLHKNIPTMIGKVTNLMADLNINISDMNNRSKGEYAYTLIDVDGKVKESDLQKIRGFEGIISIRMIR